MVRFISIKYIRILYIINKRSEISQLSKRECIDGVLLSVSVSFCLWIF